LPGIIRQAMAMPDIHWGYGFPIGGVAAVDGENGVISPGGVGYDINCGVRILRTDLEAEEVRRNINDLINAMFNNVPCGVGSKSKLRLSPKEENKVMETGSKWAVKQGYGWNSDIDWTEENGAMDGADPSKITQRAKQRGKPQLGTLGSGNHFLEIQEVVDIFDEEAARIMGLEKGLVTVMIHTGSRGFGHEVCSHSLKVLNRAFHKFGISIPDKQLVCAPLGSQEAKDYFSAMACAANYAWANRQMIAHWVRESFEQVLRKPATKMGMYQIYDVAHNIAKFETHEIDGEERRILVHRKGATRSFGPNRPEVPEAYRSIGQPVLIPGDMGTASYILVGTEKAMQETFGSTCHGAGRVMSRRGAIRKSKGRSIRKELEEKGIVVRWEGRNTLKEEMPDAYKNVSDVVDVVHAAGISRKVARMKPIGVIKG
jgi:tRNA-splicing ligase RtcB